MRTFFTLSIPDDDKQFQELLDSWRKLGYPISELLRQAAKEVHIEQPKKGIARLDYFMAERSKLDSLPPAWDVWRRADLKKQRPEDLIWLCQQLEQNLTTLKKHIETERIPGKDDALRSQEEGRA